VDQTAVVLGKIETGSANTWIFWRSASLRSARFLRTTKGSSPQSG